MVLSCAPYVPSQLEVVKKMLELAQAGPEDIIYDLGCGDGRILFTAVKDFGVKKAVGYEIDAQRYYSTLLEIERQNLENKIHLIYGNLYDADISEATVITLYLTTSGNRRLKPKLIKEARSDTKIVSHDFTIEGWQPLRKEFVRYGHTVYLYKINNGQKLTK
jgi:ribosomal protein L11 methylase PrmA